MSFAVPRYVKISEMVRAIRAFDFSCFEGAEGASQDEVTLASQYLGGPLPLAYLDFLACLGRSSGNICIDDWFDFSISAMLGVLKSVGMPPVPLFPVAFNASGDGADLLCLDLGDARKYDDPGLYTADSPDDERDPDCCWADRFSPWMARRLADKSIIERSKYVFRMAPDLSDAFYSWARTVDADASVLDILVRLGFRVLLPGCSVYLDQEGQFVSYFRSPGRRSFVLRLGVSSHSLSQRLQDELSRLMGVRVVVKQL